MRRRTVARDLGAIPGALPRRTYVLAAEPVQEDRVTAEIRGNTFLTAGNGAAVGGSFRAEISATATGSRLSGTVRARQDLRITRTGRRLGACALADGWHADRRFAGGFRSDDGRQVFDYRLSGRVAPASMSGRLRVAVRERAPKPSRCTGGTIAWSAQTG